MGGPVRPQPMMRIGELARRTGASVRSIRYYEQQGLLRARRTRSGYREFDEASVELVTRIRVLLRNGFTLEEIRAVAVELDDQTLPAVCEDVIQLYHRKLAELGARIEELRELRDRVRDRLTALEEQRRTRDRDVSPIPRRV